MILFIFEGKDDKTYFEAIKQLFFPEKSNTFVCTYNSNIYSLYTKLKEHDALKEMLEVNPVSNSLLLYTFGYSRRLTQLTKHF